MISLHGGRMKIVGKILWWDQRDQNGIIVDANGNEFYFDISIIEGKVSSLKANAVVQFTIHTEVKKAAFAKSVNIPLSKSKNKLEREFEKRLQLEMAF